MTATVALIAPRYAPDIGGVERVVEMQARELTRRGVAVEVITTDPSRQLPAVEERGGVVVRRFPTLANDGVFFLSPSLGAFLLRHGHRYAVLHAHSYHTPLALESAIASRRTRRPFVLHPHYHGTGHSPLRSWLHRPYRPIGGWVVRSAARVLCVSAVEQALLHQHFGHLRTLVTPNAIDADELAPTRRASAGDGLEIVTIGRLDAYKQADRLIAALTGLPDRARLTLVGDGPARGALVRLARDLGVAERVALVGQRSRAELLDTLRRADVFVSLSRHESFGLAVLEAAVAGLPVVASDIPAHREVARYAPAGRIEVVAVDAEPGVVADAVHQAARRGRVSSVEGWPLPTWRRHVDLVLSSYPEAVAG